MNHEELGTLNIRRVIFHDIPRRQKGSESEPTLSEIESRLDSQATAHLHKKLVVALGSKSAFNIEFDPASQSPVPNIIRSYTQRRHGFVDATASFARYLHEQQTGNSPAGLLAVLDCATRSRSALAIMKIEREEGAQLQLENHSGRKTFDMAVLANLYMTDGTKLFKSALFVRHSSTSDEFSAVACDKQRHFGDADELALFWQRFLGCRVTEEPRVAIRKFYDAAVAYVSEVVTDPIEKDQIYGAMLSELRAQKKTFSPKAFIEDYLPSGHHKPFEDFVTRTHKVSLRQIPLDTSEIVSRLRRRQFITSKGASIVVPADQPELVTVHENAVVVNDSLSRVSTK